MVACYLRGKLYKRGMRNFFFSSAREKMEEKRYRFCPFVTVYDFPRGNNSSYKGKMLTLQFPREIVSFLLYTLFLVSLICSFLSLISPNHYSPFEANLLVSSALIFRQNLPRQSAKTVAKIRLTSDFRVVAFVWRQHHQVKTIFSSFSSRYSRLSVKWPLLTHLTIFNGISYDIFIL